MSQYTRYSEMPGEIPEPTHRTTVDIVDDLSTWRLILRTHPIVVLYIWKQSCLPCIRNKHPLEKWASSVKERLGDSNNNVLFVKDCLDRGGVPIPTEGTPSATHNRMASMVPFLVIYYDGKIVYSMAGFEPEVLDKYIDMCYEDLMSARQQQDHTADPNVVFYPS